VSSIEQEVLAILRAARTLYTLLHAPVDWMGLTPPAQKRASLTHIRHHAVCRTSLPSGDDSPLVTHLGLTSCVPPPFESTQRGGWLKGKNDPPCSQRGDVEDIGEKDHQCSRPIQQAQPSNRDTQSTPSLGASVFLECATYTV